MSRANSLAVCLLAAAPLFAQTPPPDGLISPEVRPDRTVTFRLRAPKANEVSLYGDWMPVGKPAPMTKDSDGVWSTTTGPIDATGHLYWFNMDSLAIADPVNPKIKLRQRTSASLVEVPGDTSSPWAVRDVPHGNVVVEYAKSQVLNRTERTLVYLPPGYEKSSARYPVLYLLHGSGDVPDSWTNAGNANFILDNLIAGNKAKPMIVVMPAGHAAPFGQPGAQQKNTELFEQYLLKEVLPLVESKYRVAPGRQNRAIAGLSMGGGQTINVGFSHLDLFSAMGIFSAGNPAQIETKYKDLLSDPAGTNAKLNVLWIGVGDKDTTVQYPRVKQFAELLDKAGIHETFRTYEGGAHTWPVWRMCLSEFAPLLFADQKQSRRNTYHAAGSTAAVQRVVSPEVHADRTITFRMRAPKASEVNVAFGVKTIAMTKNSDGLWTTTIGPVEPEIYTYSFNVDGARVLDMSNPVLKNGRAPDASVVEIPGTTPRFDEVQDVPHGTIQIRTYRSTPLNRLRKLYVYVPPQYDTEPTRKFPVLYLRHGSGDNEANWSEDGRAGVILDNLLAQHKAEPMLIVMPNGDTDGTWSGGSSPEAIEILGKELMGDIIPMIETHYRVMPNRENRAITGLSMGGGQAFTIGLKHLDAFAWVGEFSSGLVSDNQFSLEKHLPGFLDDPAAVNRKLHLLFLSCGTEDPRFNGQLDLVDILKKHNIRSEWYSTPGAHEWKVWRHSLAEFLQKVFQPTS